MGNIYNEDDVLVDIHTTITEVEREMIKKNGWEYNDLIRSGMIAKRQEKTFEKRLSLLEDAVFRKT